MPYFVSHPIGEEGALLVDTVGTQSARQQVLSAIAAGELGNFFWAKGRVGKSSMGRCIELQLPKELQGCMTLFVSIESTEIAMKLQLHHAICRELGTAQPRSRQIPQPSRDVALRIRHALDRDDLSICVLIVDNAERLKQAQFIALSDMIDAAAELGFRLHFVLLYQSDSHGREIEEPFLSLSSNIVGRFAMSSSEFKGVNGIDELRYFLQQIDKPYLRPREAEGFSSFFARSAFEKGWRVESDAEVIHAGIALVREENGLSPTDRYPMKSLCSVLRALGALRISTRTGFSGVSEADARAAVESSNYMALERAYLKWSA